MPLVKNKLILNSGGLAAGDCAVDGNADALQEQFGTARVVADEIEAAGLLTDPDAIRFKSILESICVNLDDAQDAYVKAQTEGRLQLRTLTEKMRVWIDQKLVAKVP